MVFSLKHKLKHIFNRSTLSRALICVITCSIIFSYAVLCPQAETSTITTEFFVKSSLTTLPGTPLSSLPTVDFWGHNITWPTTGFKYYHYDPTASRSDLSKNFLVLETSDVFENLNLHSNIYIKFDILYCSMDGTYPDSTPTCYLVDVDDNQIPMAFQLSYTNDSFYDEFTAISCYRHSVILYADSLPDDLSVEPYYLLYGFYVPLYNQAGGDVGYDNAIVAFSEVEYTFDMDQEDIVVDINEVVSNINTTVTSIQNSLTNVTPEMQASIDRLESLRQDQKDKVDNVIDEMDKIDTDFGTQIGDFDDVLNDNAGTLEDIGSTSYNSFVNDVFGHWFFVSVFALFGAFAFFSRAVFG